MSYGLKVRDSEGNVATITPLVGSIVTSGIYSSPTELNGDNSYGIDIDLPGTTAIPLRNITVLCEPTNWYWTCFMYVINAGANGYIKDLYAYSTLTYYTMNASTLVMSSWTAGDCRNDDPNYWDKLVAIFPRVSWMVQSSSNLYTSVRIFSGTVNCIYDYSASAAVTAYNLYGLPSTTTGVPSFTAVIIITDWDY
jgi:hypothetical protein